MDSTDSFTQSLGSGTRKVFTSKTSRGIPLRIWYSRNGTPVRHSWAQENSRRSTASHEANRKGKIWHDSRTHRTKSKTDESALTSGQEWGVTQPPASDASGPIFPSESCTLGSCKSFGKSEGRGNGFIHYVRLDQGFIQKTTSESRTIILSLNALLSLMNEW